MRRLEGKHIVLGISGGIAAYKSVYLLRLLIKEGAEVQVVITPNGKEFITPVTLASLSGKPVVSEFFNANSGEWHSHVDLGLWADLMVVAPATASTLAKMANGVADNMLITTYLSAKEPVMVAPAMDLDMFQHPSTKRNIRTLKEDGVIVLDSGDGELASGLVGKGRMMEPEEILENVVDFFEGSRRELTFKGKKIVITAGPTHEAIDPVRFIGNHSSGKMGFALAEEFASRGADVTVIAGPVNARLEKTDNVRRIDVTSAIQMLEKTAEEAENADIVIFAAAVADYRPEKPENKKIKREGKETMELRLVKNPDIAATLGENKNGRFHVGFALETENGEANAKGKLEKKNLDMIILNPANEEGAGFKADTNRITVIDRAGNGKEYPVMHKRDCAAVIADNVYTLYSKKG